MTPDFLSLIPLVLRECLPYFSCLGFHPSPGGMKANLFSQDFISSVSCSFPVFLAGLANLIVTHVTWLIPAAFIYSFF